MYEYEIIKVNGREHVIRQIPPRDQPHIPEPNYRGTGKALCGVLELYETLEDWKKRNNKL